MLTENIHENMHQRPHLNQFWKPGDQDHILINLAASEICPGAKDTKEISMLSNVLSYFRCFVIGTWIPQSEMRALMCSLTRLVA